LVRIDPVVNIVGTLIDLWVKVWVRIQPLRCKAGYMADGGPVFVAGVD